MWRFEVRIIPVASPACELGIGHELSLSCPISLTRSPERLVSSFTARSNAVRSAGETTSDEPLREFQRPRRDLFVDRAAGGRQRQERLRACRPGWSCRDTSLRCSNWATARETLVLCMWVWAPTALPVMTPFSPSVTSTRHSGIPIP